MYTVDYCMTLDWIYLLENRVHNVTHTLTHTKHTQDDLELDDNIMEEWFSLVNEKNQLLRQEADLVYELRDLELIEQHDELEKEIRQRILKDGEPVDAISV